ncbi:amidohydrolase family protein [Aliikangiella sp. IMCC44359]|uniref:amidohydrolase family protein n=1 Tax=Aliikangiella sp. IMCC44359 TaxID=3459125 RepID=UPI00403A93DF
MRRRKLLKGTLLAGGAFSLAGAGAWYHYFDGPVRNPCQTDIFPQHLKEHELMQKALQDIDFASLWDCHFHLVGTGLSQKEVSGIWLNPKMRTWLSPLQRLQYAFYLSAACVKSPESADEDNLNVLNQLALTVPPGVKFMLLAFDFYHDHKGIAQKKESTIYTPNEFAARVAKQNKAFEWIASIHPYREDCLEKLEWCKAQGAKAVKWLPPAMNIDPSSDACNAFYDKLIELKMPLLTHAGEEKAVHSKKLQRLSNPLLLRKPLEKGVKVIVAHCATLGVSKDIEARSKKEVANFDLFSRLMNEQAYNKNLLADISALNLFNRKVSDIKKVVENQHWHSRLLYASDYPLPGVMPIISSKNLAAHQLLDKSVVPFLNEVRQYNVWLFDFLQKRFLQSQGQVLSKQVFQTKRHFD